MASDSEITLTTGKMVSVFVVSVVVCALFFGFGYSMGRGGAVRASNTNPGSTPAVVVLGQRAAAKSPATAGDAAGVPISDTPVSAGLSPAPVPESAEPHIAANGVYFVQIAAIKNQEDAELLVAALRKKDFAVFSTNNAPTDKLFHVQIGPFSTAKDAEGLRAKLVGAGYNPIVKKQG